MSSSYGHRNGSVNVLLSFRAALALSMLLGGHPDAVETGNIDAYVSCDLQEPEDAEAHYSVPLVRLPGAPTYYEWPDLPDPLSRVRRSAYRLTVRSIFAARHS